MHLQFILTGFTQDMGFRVFAFERMGEGRVRTKFTVRADLSLIRRYDIRMQELPLLCRNLLERCNDVETCTVIFTEAEMSLHAQDCAAARQAAALKRKPRRPPLENAGTGWRTPQP